MSKKIVAIGGGENGRILDDNQFLPYETRSIDAEIVSLTNKKTPNYLFIVHSQDDLEIQESYFQTMKKIYGDIFKCNCRDLKSNELTDSKIVEEKIAWADIIYEGGGDTNSMISLWRETQFDKTLIKAWEDGKVISGISAGAAFGCNFKSGQAGRAIRYNKQYCNDPRYCSLRSLLKTGDLFGVDFCYHQLPDVLDPFDRVAFADNPMDFYVGATDVESGKIIFHNCKDGGRNDIEWMRASSSMPVVSKPVRIGKYTLLDGGIVDPVPYRFMEQKGYDRNIIILTQPKGYRKKPASSLMPKILQNTRQSLMQWKFVIFGITDR